MNLRQYISKRCLGLGNVTAVIDTCSIQTKGEHAHSYVSLNADAAQHLCRRAFWVHPIYARKWVLNDKPAAAGIKNQQQEEGSDYQQQQPTKDSTRAERLLEDVLQDSNDSKDLLLALSPDPDWDELLDNSSLSSPAATPRKPEKRPHQDDSPRSDIGTEPASKLLS